MRRRARSGGWVAEDEAGEDQARFDLPDAAPSQALEVRELALAAEFHDVAAGDALLAPSVTCETGLVMPGS